MVLEIKNNLNLKAFCPTKYLPSQASFFSCFVFLVEMAFSLDNVEEKFHSFCS